MTRCEGTLTALTTTGGRGYLVILYGIDDRALFDEVLASIRLQPASAISPAPSSAPS